MSEYEEVVYEVLFFFAEKVYEVLGVVGFHMHGWKMDASPASSKGLVGSLMEA